MTNSPKHDLFVLITDDVEQNRAYIIDLLREVTPNLIVYEAEDGQAAVNQVAALAANKQRCFDLIIMDYKMPILNGAEATAAIRELEARFSPPQASFIITWSTSLNCAYRQADDWLPKMTNAKEIKAKLIQFNLLHGG